MSYLTFKNKVSSLCAAEASWPHQTGKNFCWLCRGWDFTFSVQALIAGA